MNKKIDCVETEDRELSRYVENSGERLLGFV